MYFITLIKSWQCWEQNKNMNFFSLQWWNITTWFLIKFLGANQHSIISSPGLRHRISVSYTFFWPSCMGMASVSPFGLFSLLVVLWLRPESELLLLLALLFGMLVKEPVICAAAICKPIFCSRFDSLPVFFSNWSEVGGMIVKALVPLCSCWRRAYCSCNAFCLRSNSWCRCSSSSFLVLDDLPSCELTLSQLLDAEIASLSLLDGIWRLEPTFLGSVCDLSLSLRLDLLGAFLLRVCKPKFWVACSNWDSVFPSGGRGDVGDARGDLELVLGGGGGGILLPATCCRRSAFRSGRGGLLAVTTVLLACKGCIGGLLSVSEPLGYECKRLRLPVVVLTVKLLLGRNEAESILPLRPISDICGGRTPLAGIAGGSELSEDDLVPGWGLEKVWSSSNRASSAFSARWALPSGDVPVQSPPTMIGPTRVPVGG